MHRLQVAISLLAQCAGGAVLAWLALFVLTLGLPDPVYTLSGGYATNRTIAAYRAEHHLDDGPSRRLIRFLEDLATGRVVSYYGSRPILPELPEKLSASGLLMADAIAAVVVLSVAGAAVLRLTRSAGGARDLITSTAAALPLFISATLASYAAHAYAIEAQWAGACALALFPSLLIATNIHQTWLQSRESPYQLLQRHYGLRRSAAIRRFLYDYRAAGSLLLNSIIFFITTGIPIVEWLMGLSGLGRWSLEGILRLDVPVILVSGIIMSLAASIVLLAQTAIRPGGP